MQDQDKKKIIKKISIRVIVILLLACIAAVISIRVLNQKTAEIDEKIEEAKSADTVRPASDDGISIYSDSTSDNDEDPTEEDTEEDTEEESDSQTEEETEDQAYDEMEQSDEEEEQTEDETDDTSAEKEHLTPTPTPVDEKTSEDSEDEESGTIEDIEEKTESPSSSNPTATPTVAAVSSTTAAPTATPVPTATPIPTATPVPTATPTPEPTISNPTPISYSEDLTYVTAAQTALYKSRLLEDINNYRASNGLGSLTMDDCLTSGASIRANEISTTWSHTRPNGERGIYVLAGCGGYYEYAINCIKNGLPHDYAFGENLAVSYSWSNYTGTDQEIIDLADETFTNWVNSETHRENLLYSGYTKIGLGLYVNMDSDTYHAFWTCALFANK